MPKMVFWIRQKMKVSFKLDIRIEVAYKGDRLVMTRLSSGDLSRLANIL